MTSTSLGDPCDLGDSEGFSAALEGLLAGSAANLPSEAGMFAWILVEGECVG